jgi:hypothetical protein
MAAEVCLVKNVSSLSIKAWVDAAWTWMISRDTPSRQSRELVPTILKWGMKLSMYHVPVGREDAQAVANMVQVI